MAISRPKKMKQLTNGLTLFSLFLLPFAMAQSGTSGSDQNNNQYTNFSPSMGFIIGVLTASLFLMGLFSVYICHCSGWSAGSVRPNFSILSRRGAAAGGLDPAVIETFPTFAYSDVKGLKIGKGALECAVCLNEFQDDETLRLLPKCDHVFHPECIDAWLESHVTCPVCRANLVLDSGVSASSQSAQTQLADAEMGTQQAQTADIENQQNGDVSIRVCQENEHQVAPVMTTRSSSVSQAQARVPRSRSVGQLLGRFRSHSTGHSLVQPGENMDRFTLRLPEDVRKEVINRALLNRTGSCVMTIGESGSSRGYRPGEGSTKNRIFSIFSRAPSMKSPKLGTENAEGSTSAKTVRMPSFKCLEPKVDDTSLVSDDSAMHPN